MSITRHLLKLIGSHVTEIRLLADTFHLCPTQTATAKLCVLTCIHYTLDGHINTRPSSCTYYLPVVMHVPIRAHQSHQSVCSEQKMVIASKHGKSNVLTHLTAFGDASPAISSDSFIPMALFKVWDMCTCN